MNRHDRNRAGGSPNSTSGHGSYRSSARDIRHIRNPRIRSGKSPVTSWPKSTLRERVVMARSTELKAKKDHQPADQHEPSWQRDSVDRSLRNARARAQARSDRFVAAAVELLGERDESDFTIQDVVDKSNMSQRTFYTFFDGKDSLLLAVYETILRTAAMPMMRERCEGIADPVLRLRTLMEALSEKTAMPARLSRGLSVLHLRLAESRPNDLAYALEPLHSFIVELLEGVADAGLLRDDVPLATQAALLQELLLATLHSAVLSGGQSTSADHLWAFCSAAILRTAT